MPATTTTMKSASWTIKNKTLLWYADVSYKQNAHGGTEAPNARKDATAVDRTEFSSHTLESEAGDTQAVLENSVWSNPGELLDCTYKTNKHAMPLLDWRGADSCQRSFCIALPFSPANQKKVIRGRLIISNRSTSMSSLLSS